MANITTKGPNSWNIDWNASTENISAVQAAVDTIITSAGWALYDASAGTNAKAYRAICKDGVTYKYVVLDFNTLNRLLVKTYESWNSGTHAGTNLCYLSDNVAYGQNLASGALYLQTANLAVFANARWLAFWAYQGGATAGRFNFANSQHDCIFTGVFETTVETPGDTCPPFLWIGGAPGNGAPNVCSYPRLQNNFTGNAASSASSLFCDMGNPFGYTLGTDNRGVGMVPSWFGVNPWTHFAQAWSFWAGMGSGFSTSQWELHGKVYGLKNCTRGVSQDGEAFIEWCTIPCDSDYHICPSGSNTDHWFLTERLNQTRYLIPK